MRCTVMESVIGTGGQSSLLIVTDKQTVCDRDSGRGNRQSQGSEVQYERVALLSATTFVRTFGPPTAGERNLWLITTSVVTRHIDT
jgi:hypothetical protein